MVITQHWLLESHRQKRYVLSIKAIQSNVAHPIIDDGVIIISCCLQQQQQQQEYDHSASASVLKLAIIRGHRYTQVIEQLRGPL